MRQLVLPTLLGVQAILGTMYEQVPATQGDSEAQS